MTTTKYSQESYKFYLRKRGIDWDDFRQECALVELQHPNWQDDKIARTALRQCSRAISGNRRKRVDLIVLADTKESLPAVEKHHAELAKFWDYLPETCQKYLAKAMEEATYKIPLWVKRLAISTMQDCIIRFGLDSDTSTDGKIIWNLFSREVNRTRVPIRHRVKFMTRAEVQHDLATLPIVTSRDYYDSIAYRR